VRSPGPAVGFQPHEGLGQLGQRFVEVALRTVVHGKQERAEPASEVFVEEAPAQ